MQKNTPTLHLRPFRKKDLPRALEILLSPEVSKTYMLPDLDASSASALFQRLCTLSADQSRYVRAIDVGGELVGWLNDHQIEAGALELGWVIHPGAWGRGYATEAVRQAVVQLRALGYTHVRAGAFPQNLASLRVMQKAGLQKMDITELVEYRGASYECVFYGLAL